MVSTVKITSDLKNLQFISLTHFLECRSLGHILGFIGFMQFGRHSRNQPEREVDPIRGHFFFDDSRMLFDASCAGNGKHK